MQISSEQLAPRLSRGLNPLYVFYGDETLLTLEAADRVRNEARRQGYAARDILVAETGFHWGDLLMQANSMSLFGDKKVVDLRVPSGKPGMEGAEVLRKYCGALPQDAITLITFPALDRQTQNSKWFEALSEIGLVVVAHRVDRRALPQWIDQRLKLQGQETDRPTLDFIAECVEGNLLAAYHEVQKLGLLFPRGIITFEEAKSAVLDVARYDPYQVGESVLKGDTARLVKILDGLRGEGTAPPLILWVLSEQASVLLKLLLGLGAGKSLAQLMRDNRIPSPRQNLVSSALKRLTREQLQRILIHSAKIDRVIKGLSRGDVWDELVQLGSRFCGKPLLHHVNPD
jgi:DNA polymerase III subunit delta